MDPSGNLAAYSVPQGAGNYGNVQVTNPRPGTWTGYVWSRDSAHGGTQGPVLFGAAVAKFVPFGSVSPRSITLAPGASRQVTLSVTTPSIPGDVAGAIVLNSNAGEAFTRQSTIPVTLRSLIPNGTQTFTQTLTGGNGRGLTTGQEFYYQLDAPAGLRELNAAIQLANNPNNPFTAFLVSPSGEALAEAANALPPSNTATMGAQLHVLSPAQGLWTLIVAFAPQVAGTALSEPFTVSTNESLVPAASGGLPNSSGTILTSGQAQTYNVHITNNGPSPEAYFVDGRLPGSTPLSLTSLTGPDTTVPLNFSQNIPQYLIPSHSTAFTGVASTTGSTPIQFDLGWNFGDPDVASNVGSTVSTTFSANPLAQGLWVMAPTVVGPFGATGAPPEPVHTTMSVATAPFDASVSSQTGDLWLASTDPSQLTGFSPVIVGPGQTGTLPVTITPAGPSGTHVSGTLYIDDTTELGFQGFLALDGNDVAAIAYSYTVK
ncbi:MAG: hypothetical protein JO286_06970 [Solirubrobacterales bacterium]|nr:hypothetical protein [Solirubrobacterales bacterium]